jgi:2-methylcitrate dehydratase PrpD
MNGILSGLLAALPEWTAPEKAIEMEKGFGSAFSDKPQLERGIDGLGMKYLLMDISLKAYASCSQTHSTIDGVKDLRLKHQIIPDEVQEITLSVNPVAAMVAGIAEPKDSFEGKFSLAYCAALALHGHEPVKDAFSESMVGRPELRVTCRKVKLQIVPGRGDVESGTEIHMKDGKRFSTYISVAKGNPGNELGEEDLKGKFLSLVVPYFGARSTRALISRMLECEEIENVQELGILLRRASLKALQA